MKIAKIWNFLISITVGKIIVIVIILAILSVFMYYIYIETGVLTVIFLLILFFNQIRIVVNLNKHSILIDKIFRLMKDLDNTAKKIVGNGR
jgi:hypothetical protein